MHEGALGGPAVFFFSPGVGMAGTDHRSLGFGRWPGRAEPEPSGWRAAAGSGRGAAEGLHPQRSPATWQGEEVEAESEARGRCQGASSRGGEGRSRQTTGEPECTGTSGATPTARAPPRTEQNTYWNLSCTSQGVLASWGRGRLECCRVRARAAPSSLSCTAGGAPPGGTWNVSRRVCP